MTTPQDLFSGLASSIVGDCMDRLAGTHTLRPLPGTQGLIGRALTVKAAPGDNLYIHAALRQAQPGDVLVVDAAGNIERALVGEILMSLARAKGVLGFVVDGAARDIDAFEQAGYPCYARGITLRGPYKNGPGAINVAVSIDGNVVQPGDIVVGDGDGVVFVPAAQAQAVAAAARAHLEREQKMLADIAAGTYDDSWLNPLLDQR
ncbi:RraA family protein [Pusillimonas sp. SM2304]|uniref:RraA family protein n=1 Tax=Pusillimonas sp. SM2304 TaxID=3073241 RepID=UPI002876C1F2|nr:RraA family protein [Pusillimonas sp. SM2304]MDS1139029.1 RraA family protein [Pusillimonas sp. SM2304]